MVVMFGTEAGQIEAVSELKGHRVRCVAEACEAERVFGPVNTTTVQVELGEGGWVYDPAVQRWRCGRCASAVDSGQLTVDSEEEAATPPVDSGEERGEGLGELGETLTITGSGETGNVEGAGADGDSK